MVSTRSQGHTPGFASSNHTSVHSRKRGFGSSYNRDSPMTASEMDLTPPRKHRGRSQGSAKPKFIEESSHEAVEYLAPTPNVAKPELTTFASAQRAAGREEKGQKGENETSEPGLGRDTQEYMNYYRYLAEKNSFSLGDDHKEETAPSLFLPYVSPDEPVNFSGDNDQDRDISYTSGPTRNPPTAAPTVFSVVPDTRPGEVYSYPSPPQPTAGLGSQELYEWSDDERESELNPNPNQRQFLDNGSEEEDEDEDDQRLGYSQTPEGIMVPRAFPSSVDINSHSPPGQFLLQNEHSDTLHNTSLSHNLYARHSNLELSQQMAEEHARQFGRLLTTNHSSLTAVPGYVAAPARHDAISTRSKQELQQQPGGSWSQQIRHDPIFGRPRQQETRNNPFLSRPGSKHPVQPYVPSHQIRNNPFLSQPSQKIPVQPYVPSHQQIRQDPAAGHHPEISPTQTNVPLSQQIRQNPVPENRPEICPTDPYVLSHKLIRQDQFPGHHAEIDSAQSYGLSRQGIQMSPWSSHTGQEYPTQSCVPRHRQDQMSTFSGSHNDMGRLQHSEPSLIEPSTLASFTDDGSLPPLPSQYATDSGDYNADPFRRPVFQQTPKYEEFETRPRAKVRKVHPAKANLRNGIFFQPDLPPHLALRAMKKAELAELMPGVHSESSGAEDDSSRGVLPKPATYHQPIQWTASTDPAPAINRAYTGKPGKDVMNEKYHQHSENVTEVSQKPSNTPKKQKTPIPRKSRAKNTTLSKSQSPTHQSNTPGEIAPSPSAYDFSSVAGGVQISSSTLENLKAGNYAEFFESAEAEAKWKKDAADQAMAEKDMPSKYRLMMDERNRKRLAKESNSHN